MKNHVRRVAAAVLVAVLYLHIAPVAAAAPRNSDRDVPSSIVRVIQKLQKLFGISSNHDLPQPPRP